MQKLNFLESATNHSHMHTFTAFLSSSSKLKPSRFSDDFESCTTVFFPPLLPISRAFFTELLVAGKNDGGRKCVRVCVCGHARGNGQQKHCTKLRAALRFPPEAELRLSSLFSRTGFQLWDEKDGELLCLCCGSSNPAVHWELVKNIAKRERFHPSHLDGTFSPFLFLPSKFPT